MRTLDATLLAAMDTGNYDPYFLATIQDVYNGNELFIGQPTGYELSDLELVLTVQMPRFLDVPFYRTSIVLTRGVTIAGLHYTLSTSKFTIINSTWDGNFQTFKCHLIPRIHYSAPGDQTYKQVIDAFCLTFGKTAVYLDPAAAWLSYQFLPTGKTLTLNNAQTLFQQLKQKYFIFACDNGNDEILFYTAFTHAASPQYQITGYRFAVDYNVDQRRQYIWRDENETLHKTSPSFAYSIQPDANEDAIMSLCDLGTGVVLAGSSKNVAHGGKIFRSTDYGVTWDAGYDLSAINGSYVGVYSLLSLGGGIVLAAGYYGGFILRSVDYGVTWSQVYSAGVDSTQCLTDLGGGVVLCGHANTAKIYKSLDYGLTWAQAATLGTETAVNSIVYIGAGVVLAGSAPTGQVWRSTDSGSTWGLVQQLGTQVSVYSMLSLGNGIVLAGTGNQGRLFKSTDSGASWVQVYASGEFFIYTLNTLGGGVVIAGTGTGGKVLRSIDFGTTWDLIQVLGSESEVRSFLTLGNGSTLAGTSSHAMIYKSLNCAADLDIIHNLGFMPSTAVEPSAYFLLAQPKFDPFPVHPKYQSSDFIRVNLLQGGTYDFTCAEVIEVLDLKQPRMPFRQLISQTEWLSNTATGPLPSTIERVASYTPLVSTQFDSILSSNDNNLQAAMDTLDDHTHGPQLDTKTEKPTPDDADLFSLVDSLTVTHLVRKITWADIKAAIPSGGGGLFGDGADGDVVISVDTTLTADMFYNDLTINAGIKLNTNGYQVFVKGTLWNKGIILCNGGNGGDGATTTGGASGARATTNKLHFSLPGVGASGAGAAAAGTSNGAAGVGQAPTLLAFYTYAYLQAGGGGGGGGNHAATAVQGVNSVVIISGATGGAGGAGVGTNSTQFAGGGGGAGGGVVEVWAATINNPGTIQANGGNGGSGQFSGTTKAGNGGGGAGGSVIVFYRAVAGSGLGTVQALGGSPGANGNGGASGSAGLVITSQI